MALFQIKKALGFRPRQLQQDSKSVTLTDSEALSLFGAIPTSSGIQVSPNSALKVPAVACAVGLISETMGGLPAKLHDAENKDILADHPAHKLIHREANPWTSAAQLREQLTLDALMHGAGHALVIRNANGDPIELHRLEHGRCQHCLELDGTPYYLVTPEGAGQVRMSYADVLRVEAFGAVSPITLGREAIGLAMQFENHMSGVFSNGGRPSGVITSTKVLDVETKKKLAASWFATHGGKNAGATALLDEGMSYNQIAMTMVDTQFAENRLEQIREIARVFRVPPTLIFELTRGTWSNTEQMMRQFLTLTLKPWIETWEWGYARCLLTDQERDELSVSFDVDNLLSADHAAKATAFSQYRAAGVMTANDVRENLNLPPREDGNELSNPFTTSNTTPPANNENADPANSDQEEAA
ncbi:phage portal protein [Tateyamaria sp. SN3-11]|uniref:phage portal protein n=1 Tax=Tateyamaria sp. SN3-11 TaxID=3092147 RepID=UPI0039EA24C1